MSYTECTAQLELFEVERKRVTVNFEGGQVVTDAGLLPIRQLDLKLGILAEAARRLPRAPRSPLGLLARRESTGLCRDVRSCGSRADISKLPRIGRCPRGEVAGPRRAGRPSPVGIGSPPKADLRCGLSPRPRRPG